MANSKLESYKELLEILKVKDAQDSLRVELNHADLRVFIYLLQKKITLEELWEQGVNGNNG